MRCPTAPRDPVWFFPGLVITNLRTRTTHVVIETKGKTVYLRDVFADSSSDVMTTRVDGHEIINEAEWLHENFKIYHVHPSAVNDIPIRPGTESERTIVFKTQPMSFEMAERIQHNVRNVNTLRQIIDTRQMWFWGNGKYHIQLNPVNKTVERMHHKSWPWTLINLDARIGIFLATAYLKTN